MPFLEKQIDFDRELLDLAFSKRSLSDDPKARIVDKSGVVAIITRSNDIIAMSANVLPPRLKEKFAANQFVVDDSSRYGVIEHAERAAIYSALVDGKTLQNATLYCTRFPCSDCARAIIWCGIDRVVVPSGDVGETLWKESQEAALEMLGTAGITVSYTPPIE